MRLRGDGPAAPGLPRWHLGAVLAACFVVYGNCLGHAFVWDDQYLVIDNPQIKNWHRVATLFSSDLFPPVVPSGYYRPLQALTNLVDYQLWGLSPAGFHLTNVMLHAATALMLYALGAALLASTRAALVAALLFVVHPLHTEAIAYVSGRSDPLSALFLLAAMWAFATYCQRGRVVWRALSLACFALALMAREAALALLFLLPLVEVTVRRARGESASMAQLLRSVTPYGIVFLAYLLVRRAVIEAPGFVGPPGDTQLGWRLLTMMNVLGQYVGLLLIPINLHMERQVPVAETLIDPFVLIGFAVFVALFAAAVRLRRTAWPVTLGTGWFLLALIPVANVWPLATFMAEHWLYVPSMGLFLVAGWAVDRLTVQGWQQPAATAVVLTLVGWGLLTIMRNRDWRDAIPLYEATTRSAPHSVRAWTNLAHAYEDGGQPDAARNAYEHALQAMSASGPVVKRRHSDRQEAQELALVAGIQQQRGHFADAEASYRAALALDPTMVSAYNNLGLALNALGRADDAETAFVSAVRLYPDFAAAHSNRGNVLFRRGDLVAAKAAYETAIAVNPEYSEAYNNLGSVYFRLGETDRASAAYRHALQLNPGLDEVRRNLSVVEAAGIQQQK